MLPKHGFAYGVFLLARAARIKRRRSVAEWVDAARAPDSYLSTVTDLRSPAETLIQLGLAQSDAGGITLTSSLLELSDMADRATLRGVVRLLLATRPPQWLRFAVTSAGVAREYIPSLDLAALEWLEPDLDDVLLDVHADVGTVDRTPLRKAIGDAAELLVFAALDRAGAQPVHVARLSDSYGYDIETRKPVSRIEVKAAGATTRGSFHISRNEFDKSQRYGVEWHLVQVVFSSAALVADTVDSSHVEGVFELSSDALAATVPADSPGFMWTESAYVTPPQTSWCTAKLTLDPDFTTPGFRPVSLPATGSVTGHADRHAL